jgi:heme/copper-type cytochrome/quinol oxidase subunit 2
MDSGFRLQCAELCGLGHAGMSIPVRVVEASEFDSWLAEQNPVR